MINQVFHSWYPHENSTPRTQLLLGLAVLVGAALRFWGLGNIGLHGDEELMALATRGLVEAGSPILPSGMYYGRAFPQLYLMAGSVYLFGESEWSLRLPSAIVGTLAIVIAYFLGRRFLTSGQSVAFAFVIALLPNMIALSQTARMYGFYVTFAMLFAVAVFRWERAESLGVYCVAITACLLALSFHTLTAFSMLLFFYPGILKRSWRLLIYGVVAFVFSLVLFEIYSSWISSQYFSLVTIPSEDDSPVRGFSFNTPSFGHLALAALGVTVAGGITLFRERIRGVSWDLSSWRMASVACLAAAFAFTWLLHYHLAVLVFLVGAILFIRAGLKTWIPLSLGALLVAMMCAQAITVWRSGEFDGVNSLILYLLGAPSAWSYLIFARFAPLAVVVSLLITTVFVVRFARRQTLPDHVLFLFMAVFVPLFLIGFFRGHLPERYLVGLLPFFILSVFAGTFDVIRRNGPRYFETNPTVAATVAGSALALLFVSPTSLRDNVNPKYSDFSRLEVFRGVDHKGAAEFILSQALNEDDLVIAMDAQQQSYYLGSRLDYYLRSLNERRNSSFLRNNDMVNLYTGTPQISTGEELAHLFEARERGRIFIIGSGELESNRPRYIGDGIWDTMVEYDVEIVHQGRDNSTKVWRYPPMGVAD